MLLGYYLDIFFFIIYRAHINALFCKATTLNLGNLRYPIPKLDNLLSIISN